MRQLITDALIVNGDGVTDPYAGDALIDGGLIVSLGSVPPRDADSADRVIDARGRVLAPGFVDTHNHGALGGTRIGPYGLPVTCELAVRGGVTKRICGVDGLSPAPVVPAQRAEYASQLAPLDGRIGTGDDRGLAPSFLRGARGGYFGDSGPSDDAHAEWTWSTVAEFYRWHRGRSVTDMGMHLGHSAVRRTVMGNLHRAADDEQIRAMCEVVRQEAPWTLGLSTGLVYNPAVYSDKRELAALVRAFNEVKPAALYPHLRSESDDILASLDEVIIAAVDGGGAYCNEHSKIAGRHNWEKFRAVADRLSAAADSVPTMENMYPWPAGNTTGDTIFPPEMRAGSRFAFLARLSSLAVREKVYEKMRGDSTTWDNFLHFCGGLDGIQISGAREGVGDAFLGMRLGDVARAAGHRDLESKDAYFAVFDFFLANGGDVNIITHYGNDALVERFFRRPRMSVCTDGMMPGPGQKPHPRSLGAFPKALRMARQLGIPLKEIVYRLSVLPCEFVRLRSPVLRPGGDASMVMFDWDTVRECNSFEYPMVPPEGIDGVWVHGDMVNEGGLIRPPATFAGRHLISRPAR